MKINAIGVDYNIQGTKNMRKVSRAVEDPPNIQPTGFRMISFKAGNKDQVMYWGMELKPYSSVGGIGTVLTDHRGLKTSENDVIPNSKSIDYYRQKNKVFVDPLYNGKDVYDYNTGLLKEVRVGKIPTGLKADSAFKKYEGMLFYTNDAKFKNYANELDYFNNEETIVAATGKPKLNISNQIHILKEVGEPIQMDFGGGKNGTAPVRLFRVQRFDEKTGELVPINDFKVMTDVSLTWKKPYEGGGYASAPGALGQTWKGDGDARSSKAFVEMIERICKEVSKDGYEYRPATLLLNDSHAANAIEYMVQKIAKGDTFLQDIKPELIGHNLAAGYVQRTSYMNMFVNIADKELRDAVRADKNFIEAMLKGEDAINDYFKKILPKEIIDAQGGVSPFQNALYYADKGFVPKVITVSEGYHDVSVKNRELIPAQFDMLQKLDKDGKYIGITNGSSGVNPFSADTNPYFKGYTFPSDISEAGKVKGKTLTPYKVFDETKVDPKKSTFDINHIREIKEHNKAALLERFDKDVIDALRAMQNVKGHEYDYASVIAAFADKKIEVYGHIDPKYITAAKQKNNNVKVLITWGRGDLQKGIDTVIKSFEKYVEKFEKEDPNVVLVAGGEIPKEGDEGKALRALIEKLDKNPKTKGRFVFLDGFAPNKPLIMGADFSVLPSRFAPCELTDLESIKGLCPPIVSNCQGLAQKNFDATFEGEAGKVTGYKTKHDYYMSYDELKNILKPEDKANFEKDMKEAMDKIALNEKLKHNKVLSQEEIMKKLCLDDNYKYLFEITRKYRDGIIEDELVDAYERALQKDYKKDIQATMIKNDYTMGIGWENNAGLSKYNKSSGQLYREAFRLDNTQLKEEDTLLYKLRENCKEILENYRKTGGRGENNGTSFGGRISQFFHSKGGKWAVGGAVAAAAAAGIGYVGYKSGWFSPQFDKKEESGHLSAVV